LRTKAAGDAALRASTLDWVIFKPGLVLSPNAFGGTSLLRMLAALPLIQLVAHSNAKVQTVAIDDVSDAVRLALSGSTKTRADYDLVEDEAHELGDIVSAMRRWLGLKPALFSLSLPGWTVASIAFGADVAGLLGWRSPLRSTAMKVMSENVLGDPSPWRKATGRPNRSVYEFLNETPATAQERLYARAQLALPLIIVTLGVFWIASGVVGLARLSEASAHLLPLVGAAGAKALVGAASLLDIGVGAAILTRKTARQGAILSIFVAGSYLLAGTLIEPALWLDPLGVYVKVLPAMALAATAALLIGDR
jgi:hypothetical protein